jgi:hypothetical protein
MWLLWLLAPLIALMIAGGIFFGGIYTLILVPLAGIALLVAILWSVGSAAAQRSAGGSTDPAETARGNATRTSQTGSPQRPARPGELADARRARQ